ncbi:unnamed protein product [Amaranthus hypochondriacus]
MPRYKDEPTAVRVYTVCDESKYLIVRNVPALGCGDQLKQLFSTYGGVEECKPMDAEECEQFTDVYWIKFHLISNARYHMLPSMRVCLTQRRSWKAGERKSLPD